MSQVKNLKRRRVEDGSRTCIICQKASSLSELSRPNDVKSWQTLYKAASVRNYEPILQMAEDDQDVLPDAELYYHGRCRDNFTHKKSLAKVQEQDNTPPSVMPDRSSRRSSAEGPSTMGRVYEKTCIFCLRVSKYTKGTRTRECLKPAVELRADQKVREIATARSDERILAVATRDLIAAEAHFHRTCYRDYTRPPRAVQMSTEGREENDQYQALEKQALQDVFEYIRNDVFQSPRIIPLVDITYMVANSLASAGIDDVHISTKKNLKRSLIAEFGESLKFFTENNRVYLMPDNLTRETLAIGYIRMESKLKAFEQRNTDEDVTGVALSIRGDIKCRPDHNTWPPHPAELTPDYVDVPTSLQAFLKALLCGNTDSSTRNNRLAWSIAMDIITAVSCGAVKTSKHLLLPWVIKTLTGNVEVIKILNRLGHGCSYSVLEEIDTALCIDKMETIGIDDVPLPSNVHQSVPTVLAFDNIDRQEESLSGAGTTHRVNGIVVQPRSMSCAAPKPPSGVSKADKKRSINPPGNLLPFYTVGKREGPPAVKPADLLEILTAAALTAHRKNLTWVLTRFQDTSDQTVSSWTGYNIMTRDHTEVAEDAVGYLPTINAPATEMSTVQEILRNSLRIMSLLHLENIAVVFDQALFAKATEIGWKHPDTYGNIVFMMGNFHTICNFMSSIGRMFGGAGLRDLAVEAGVIAEGSMTKVLEAKQYNRAVRLHKLVYEALLRLAWQGFTTWLESNHPADVCKLTSLREALLSIRENICHETVSTAMGNGSCSDVLDMFQTYLDVMRQNHGQLAQFWMMYVDMVEILLGLLRADREGDWHLHLACVRRVIPWCFALNKINYARYLPVYYAQMTNLEETCPDLYHHFRRGYFSVQLKSGNPFARIPVDQTTEETVNKDTQTAGGTRGFSVKPGAVARYYLTSEHRADALRQLREMIHLNSKSSLHHHDLAGTRIQKDEADVGAMVDLLENDWVNPFGPNPSDLISISTGSVATPTQSSDILNALHKGEEAYQCFQNQRLQEGRCFYDPIKKMNLEMFGEAKKATLKGTHKEITLKADRRLFGTMVLVAKNRNLSMPEVFSHPLGPIPWSLANPDGTMKKTNKAALAQHLEKLVEPTETITEATATIIDAMALIQKLHGENQTFQQLSDRIFEASLNAGRGSDRIDVVFDVYLDQSIKSAERVKRGSQEGVLFKSIRPAHKIKNWRRLLTCGQTKNMLSQFLAESWRAESKRERLGGRTMFVTCGEKCFQLTRDGSEEVTSLVSNHEEADTRLLLHAKHSASDHQAIIIMSDDTDVFVIALSLIKAIGSRIYIRRGTRSRIRMIDITKVAAALGDGVCSALPGLHAWTGCDSVSALAGQGKIKALKILQTDEAFREAFISLGESWNLTQDHFDRIKEFTCTLYSRKTKSEDVNALRYQLFCSKKGDVESGQLPPCEDTLQQHTLRANYQTAIWRRSLQGVLDCPKPSEGHGWTIAEDGELAIQWMTGVPAPEAVMNFISCSCTRHCRETDCSCILNGLRCTELCKLQSCVNMEQEDSDVEQDSDDSDDDSD